jgi:hypothetical protein
MSNTYYLRGPVSNGSQVYLTAVIGNYLYFLTRNGTNLILDPRNPGLLGGPQALISTLNIKNNSTISLTYGSGGSAGVDQNNHIMIQNTNSGTQFSPVATDLNAGSPIVAGPIYTLEVGGNPVEVYAYTPVPNPNPNTNTVFASDILMDENGVAVLQSVPARFRFLPLKWYLSTNCGQTLGSTTAVINNEALWTESNLFGTQTGFQTGFTNQTDCNNGVFYDYCFLPANCGEANNCFGACSNTKQTCKLNSNSGTFSCVNNSTTNQWWFWLIVAIIAIIVIALLIWLIVYATKSGTPTATVTEETVTTYQPVQTGYAYTEEFI